MQDITDLFPSASQKPSEAPKDSNLKQQVLELRSKVQLLENENSILQDVSY